ncbi:hypothetical protein ACJX0J_033784, partial [Zea mays]
GSNQEGGDGQYSHDSGAHLISPHVNLSLFLVNITEVAFLKIEKVGKLSI